MRRHPDPAAIRAEVRATYDALPADPAGAFPYATGREGALALGYEPRELDRIPGATVRAFVGVGNPLALGEIAAGARILDIGCGAGLDAALAARRAGPSGLVAAIDLSPRMLRAAFARGRGAPRFALAAAEALPFAGETFDLAISNGVLNLSPDKPRAFAEILRALRPGGALRFADVVRREGIPADVAARLGAWSA